MGAKVTYSDVAGNVLSFTKMNFGASTSLKFGSGVPSANETVGSFYVDTASGNLYRKTASGASNWRQISSVTSTVFQNHYHDIIINSAVTATDTGAASLGDLVGIYGAGAWAASGSLSATKAAGASAGSNNAGLVSGGLVNLTNSQISTFLFNGSTWAAASGNLGISRNLHYGAGAQNAAFVTGGLANTTTSLKITELFNGAAWAAAGVISFSKYSGASAGYSQSGLIVAGTTLTPGFVTASELFNGTSWNTGANITVAIGKMAGTGAQNSALIAGGEIVARQNVTELFNGSAWAFGGNITLSRAFASLDGSQSSARFSGGNDGSAGFTTTELFNGTVWTAGGNLGTGRSSAGNSGGQNSGLITGGFSTSPIGLITTELHTQSTYRKLYSREYAGAKSLGILINPATVQQQGSVTTSVVYVPNKWLIVNRFLNSVSTNDASLTSVSLLSIQGSAPTPTYNFSATVLSVVPGMMAIVTTAGGFPAPAADYGTFLITRVINPGSIEITNSSAVAQNPATGTISFISTMLAVDQIGPQDVVIGRTDDSGFLTIHKPITVGSLNRRLV